MITTVALPVMVVLQPLATLVPITVYAPAAVSKPKSKVESLPATGVCATVEPTYNV